VALGHYHVHREIAPNAFYAGSLEYTSANPWGELLEERSGGLSGKGFVEYDLDARRLRFHAVTPARRHIDLPALSARGMTAAELDAAIAKCIEECEGGIDEQVVRLVVRDVPRHIARELDHKALRDAKRRALHFHLDTRRPDIIRSAASRSIWSTGGWKGTSIVLRWWRSGSSTWPRRMPRTRPRRPWMA
jgi:DNA repair exonuclease SbcCD nuclease subunit